MPTRKVAHTRLLAGERACIEAQACLCKRWCASDAGCSLGCPAPPQDFTSTKGRVMRFQTGGSWQMLGPAFSSGAASYISLALHPATGLPWVAFLVGHLRG